MPAINTSTVPTAVAVMLLRIHRFVADHARCTFVGARLYHICGVGGRRVQGDINLLTTETRKQRSSVSYASLLGCMRCAPVCEVDCEEEDGLFRRSVGEAVVEVACGCFFERRRLVSFDWFLGGGLLQVV